MAAIVETLAEVRPRTQRTVTRRRAALRHDIEVAGTARAKPPRDLSWRTAVIIILLHSAAIALAMRWEGYFDWW